MKRNEVQNRYLDLISYDEDLSLEHLYVCMYVCSICHTKKFFKENFVWKFINIAEDVMSFIFCKNYGCCIYRYNLQRAFLR